MGDVEEMTEDISGALNIPLLALSPARLGGGTHQSKLVHRQ